MARFRRWPSLARSGFDRMTMLPDTLNSHILQGRLGPFAALIDQQPAPPGEPGEMDFSNPDQSGLLALLMEDF